MSSTSNTAVRSPSRRPIAVVVGLVLVVAVAVAVPVGHAEAASPPTIDVWYGDLQEVGARGQTQRWANVLGRVGDADGPVASLSYRLNGGSPRALTIGPGNNPRLLANGDFNVEIDRAELTAGDNAVVITAVDASGTSTSRTVTLRNTPQRVWPLPTSVTWAGVTSPTQVVDVVDGRWQTGTNGVSPLDYAYDRLFAVGDRTWTNYAVEVPVTIHDMDPNVGGVGVFLRWTGHTEAPPHEPGMQPRVGWRPSGALAWYRAGYSHPTRLELANDDESVMTVDGSGFTLAPGVTYIMRASVVRTADGDVYGLTVHRAGQPAGSGVTITATDTEFRKANGSVLFIANRALVTFGDISVSPLTAPPPPPPPPANVAPVAVADSVSTPVSTPVGVPVLANDSDSDGTLVASSVSVVSQPAHGSTSVGSSGVVTYTPAAGYVGADAFTYRVADDDGALSNVASVSVSVTAAPPPPPPPPAGLVSDEFSSGLGSQWTWVNPVGDATVAVSGGLARLAVPAGVSHDLWTGAFRAPRLLQATPNVDFDVQVKIDSPMTARYQLQGLVAQQDADDLLRAELHHDGSGVRVFVATFVDGRDAVRAHSSVGFTASFWLRLVRVGDAWTFSASDDGVTWVTVATFTHRMVVNQVGIFAGNHNPNPSHTATFDHFRVAGA
jgi:regulation of enolase protein 1 (concanavalin A-like superfamily)